MGVFFVNSQQDADMLKRANRKIEIQNGDTVNSNIYFNRYKNFPFSLYSLELWLVKHHVQHLS